MKKIVLLIACAIQLFNIQAQLSTTQVKDLYLLNTTGLIAPDVNDLTITSQYTDKHNGVTHIYITQRINGIDIQGTASSMHLQNNKVVWCNNAFIPHAASKTNTAKSTLSPGQALQISSSAIGLNMQQMGKVSDIVLTNHAGAFTNNTFSAEPILMKETYVVSDNTLRLAYEITQWNDAANNLWMVTVDALTGEILSKLDLTTKCSFNHDAYQNQQYRFESVVSAYPGTESLLQSNRSMKKASTSSAKYNVYPIPAESPIHGPRMFINPYINDSASPYGWHDTDGVAGADYSTTRGNNVYAREDTLAKNGNGFSPDGGTNMEFDFFIDTSWQKPRSSLSAAITQLFYMNNIMHDVTYNYGFNEVSGNFQVNNYGKGGRGKDNVQADAQDGSGTSNANFSTPVDSLRGRMQMYLWPTSAGTNILNVNVPATWAGSVSSPLATFGPQSFSNFTQDIVVVSDSSSADSCGCNTLKNAAALNGKIALAYRNTACANNVRVLNAQNAGAIAVIVIQNTTGSPTTMTGINSAITIPSVMIFKSVGDSIRIRLRKGLTVSGTFAATVTKTYDSDFDNGVMAHEYGHGISNRLTGGPLNSSCLQNGEQGGEGWSDFFALIMTVKPGDKGTDARGVGTYVSNQPTSGPGIRTFKYSTDSLISNVSYDDIKTAIAPHGVGSIWCQMLWDLYWNMSDKYGWSADIYNGTGGNNKAIQLVMDGMKLQKCSPGFVDARNAILMADSINYGGANYELIWRTFARRGLGYSANQGSSSSKSDGSEAYDLPPSMTVGVKKYDLNNYFSVIPNPSNGMIQISGNTIANSQVHVLDITGKLLLIKDTHAANSMQLDLSDLPNGVYFIRVESASGSSVQKVILAK